MGNIGCTTSGSKKNEKKSSHRHGTKNPESSPRTQQYEMSSSVSKSPNTKTSESTFHSKYFKGDELGRGAFSKVYKAIDKETNITYAAKQIIKAKLSLEDEVGLQQEIEILQSLDDKHIVKFIDFFDEIDYYYVVLEHLQGGELFDRIVQKSCYTEKEARDLVFIILTAIKCIHDNNIVHRDLKPENLLMATMEDDTNVKIADFGFAKRASGFTLVTQCGSPGYVAPEIISKAKYGKPVDMWSVGVITYIILGGYPPFYEEHDQNALFRKIRKGLYEFHQDYWGHISEEAKDLIRGLLTVDVKTRLTVDQALQHPWILRAGSELASRNLDASLTEFKKFIANRRFKAAANAVIAIRRFSRSFIKVESDSITSSDKNTHDPTGAVDTTAVVASLLELSTGDETTGDSCNCITETQEGEISNNSNDNNNESKDVVVENSEEINVLLEKNEINTRSPESVITIVNKS